MALQRNKESATTNSGLAGNAGRRDIIDVNALVSVAQFSSPFAQVLDFRFHLSSLIHPVNFYAGLFYLL
jgi:hypothetical protein